METSRRGAIGAMIGGMMAGPSVAKAAAAEMSKVNVASAGQLLTGGGIAAEVESPLYLKHEYEGAVKSRDHWRGEIAKSRLNNGDRDSIDRIRIDGLKSVSPVNKHRLAAEADHRRYAERELQWAEERIASLKERLGLLGVFL